MSKMQLFTSLFSKLNYRKAIEQTMINEWSGIFPKKENVARPVINRFETI